MENEIIFLCFLWGTFTITRISAHLFHDYENYNKSYPRKSKAKTMTGYLRRKTGFDWHHIHLGIVLIVISPIILKFNYRISLIILAIGVSLFSDQIFPLLNFGNYFKKKMFFTSILIHITISLLVLVKILLTFFKLAN